MANVIIRQSGFVRICTKFKDVIKCRERIRYTEIYKVPYSIYIDR